MPFSRQLHARGPGRLGSPVVWPVVPLLSLFAGGCRGSDSCADHVEKVESCQLRFKTDICATEYGRCAAACYARASCDELRDESGGTPGLDRCVAKCSDVFTCGDGGAVLTLWQCDGVKDCVDGSDERACNYFECANGQLVKENAVCNDYVQCGDGSDEEGCR